MPVTDEMIRAGADAICKSRKFETGLGTCAMPCLDQLGDLRAKGCAHAERIHGKLARTVIESALSAAPPSDDYRRGMEEASKNLNFRIGYLEESMRQIARIENKMSSGDWEEIEEARAIADRAIRGLGGSK